MTTTKSFLGIPVEGDISTGSKSTPQRPLEEFAPILQAVLNDRTIVEFGWSQYTPYFNDGDPCVFSAHSVWVRTDTDADVENDDGENDEDTFTMDYGMHPSIGGLPFEVNPETGRYEHGSYQGPDEARYHRCRALNAAVQSGEFNNVLLEAFGDHANIKVTRTGIQVETYEHD